MRRRDAARIKRLLDDLRRPSSRADAVRRVRKKAAAKVLGSSRPAVPGSAAKGAKGRGKGKKAATPPPRSWYVGQWSRLAGAVLGPDAAPKMSPRDAPFARTVITRARRQGAQSMLAEALAQWRVARAGGVPEPWRTSPRLRSGTRPGRWRRVSVGCPEARPRRPWAMRCCCTGDAIFDRVWTTIQDLDDDALRASHPGRGGRCGARGGDERRPATALGHRDGCRETWPPRSSSTSPVVSWPSASANEPAELVAELRRRPSVELDERRRLSWSLIEGWLDPTPVVVPDGALPVAVLQYQSPDHGPHVGQHRRPHPDPGPARQPGPALAT